MGGNLCKWSNRQGINLKIYKHLIQLYIKKKTQKKTTQKKKKKTRKKKKKIKTNQNYKGITSHQSEWPSSSKSLQTINAEESVEKKESFYNVGNVNWYNHYGEECGTSSKN